MHKRFGTLTLLGFTAASLVTGGIWLAEKAQADYSLAYCEGEDYAVNVYRSGDPEAPTSELKIRIFYRPDGVTFLNTPANREPNPEGYNYSNVAGENQWTLFIPNSTDSQCSLSRDGEVVDQGTVTMREPSSGD